MKLIRVLAVAVVTAGLTVPAQAEAESWTGPLSTRGRYVVDADGDRFKLRSGNWHGASGTWNGSGDIADPANHHAGEKADQVPLGLDRATAAEIIDSFTELGVNSVRLPFSNQMIRETRPVTGLKDQSLNGKTPLQIYDAIVEELTDREIAVILNNHTATSRWCCAVDGNERWNTSQTTQQWIDDWVFMANRYRSNKRVVGADLYNEVRRTVWDDPNWGRGNQHDWHRAAQQAGDRILETSPDLLVIVEGINWTGIPVDGLPHGRPTLEPAKHLSHTLIDSGKLVYSAHFYGYTGPNHTGATGAGETSDPRYQDLSPAELREVLRRQAFYITQAQQHFTAPLWISEFGVGGRDETSPRTRAWFETFVDHLIETDADFAYWPLVGFHHNRTGNGWALMHWDASGNRMGLHDGDDWRANAWTRLVRAPGRAGQVPHATRWSMLTLDHADFVQSRKMRARPDWNPGARKGVCPDGQQLIGLSHTGNRGLCTDGPQWTGYVTVKDERHVEQDWASGYTKAQCPRDHVAIGYSVKGSAFDGLLCGKAPTGTRASTVWFDRGDNRPLEGGDFASGHYKGQCARDEHVAGVAYTGRSGKRPAALLCRKSV